MSSKMLIDAAHPEETRVVVVRGNRLEDFDYESASRKQLKGNIYLAKVTRVEPSLQAAFVDYGGNRHGFLAFSEIHPDYYQIPVADRQALLAEEAEEESKAQAEEAAYDDADSRRGSRRKKSRKRSNGKSGNGEDAARLEASGLSETVSEAEAPAGEGAPGNGEPPDNQAPNGDSIESVGLEDALEEVPVRARRRRNYKIQEVIKRRQIILVQVVKEERGNKGAALTTYISLAGRYTVLMPNTARGGGISRKITNPTDRKRLRKIAGELDVPKGMGLIIRTAGAARTKAEIKRDFEYLLRMWENIRDLTLRSTAPTLVYEEGNLIKRSIRDLYSKEIEGVEVAGEEAYKEAKDFMKLLMPSHARNVKPYKEPEPIFVRYQIERQLGAMFSPHVTLKSGGYIVINQTEALVSIDVNSGKSTREHSIEDTALRTNLEAADEISRQLRLRDLAGLIVIDFIDMEERRNNRSVERRLKDALKTDRARIQLGRISPFGLMEMSRQRLRAGVVEGSTGPCAVCQGTGIVRSTESVSLDILRTLEDTLMNEGRHNLVATTSHDAALYILNQKRASLEDIEQRYGVTIMITGSHGIHGADFTIERHAGLDGEQRSDGAVVQMDEAFHAAARADGDEEDRKGSRRRRRGGGRGDRDDSGDTMEAGDTAAEGSDEQDSPGRSEGERRPRRRGRRGGRRSRGRGRAEAAGAEDTVQQEAAGTVEDVDSVDSVESAEIAETPAPEAESAPVEEAHAEEKPKRKTRRKSANSGKAKAGDDGADKPAKRSRRKKTDEKAAKEDGDVAARADAEPAPESKPASDGNGSGEWSETPAEPEPAAAPQPAPVESGESESSGPRRRGWWQRRA